MPFNVEATNKGEQTVRPPFKAQKALDRLNRLLRGLHPEVGTMVYKTYVRSAMLYGCVAHAEHPKTQKLQNSALAAILRTFRNTRLHRTHLTLNVVYIRAQVAILRASAAFKIRGSRLHAMRELIDTALADGWAWGRLLQADLDTFGLAEDWTSYCAAYDRVTPDEQMRLVSTWKSLVKRRVHAAEQTRIRRELFPDVPPAAVAAWKGAHPFVTGRDGAYGYMLLRNEFAPPHVVHGRAGPLPPCPCCKAAPDTPAHLLCCPSCGDPAVPEGLDLTNIPARYNLRDTAVIARLQCALKARSVGRYARLAETQREDSGPCPPMDNLAPAHPLDVRLE